MAGLFGKEPGLFAQQQLSMFRTELQLSSASRNGIGAWGEQWAAAALESAGYAISTTGRGEKRGDLRAVSPDGEIIKIEVKTARRGRSGLWKWSLYKSGKTDVSDSDVLICLAILKSGGVVPFVMPVGAVVGLKSFQISTHPNDYHGRFAKYRAKGNLKIEFEGESNDGE